MNRQQVGAARAKKLIGLYNDHSLSAEDVCREMGWNTARPAQMMTVQVNRLRKRGYDIPHRQKFQATVSKYK